MFLSVEGVGEGEMPHCIHTWLHFPRKTLAFLSSLQTMGISDCIFLVGESVGLSVLS